MEGARTRLRRIWNKTDIANLVGWWLVTFSVNQSIVRRVRRDGSRGISIVLTESFRFEEWIARESSKSKFHGLETCCFLLLLLLPSPPPFLARQWYRLPKKNTRTTIPHWFSTSTPHAIVGAIVYTVSRPADFREESRIVSSKGEEEVAKGICRLLSLLNRRKTSLVPSACSQPPTAFISVSNLQAELYTQRSVSNYRVSSL